jgi:hypothetical protein
MTDTPRSVALCLVLILCFASIARADDFKTINGKEYKNVTVKRVESDGIVLASKSGIAKIYFTELPKEVQERFNYNPESAADIMKQADAALWNNRFAQGAELLNRIVSEYPASPQAKTVRELRSDVRDKGASQDAPLTASEAQKLRSVMDALANIKKAYRTATPEKREAMETLLGVENLRDADTGLSSVPSSGANLQSAAQNANARATSGTEGLPPITVELKNEILNALRMTDKLDALYKGGCSSAEFVAAATPVEGVVMNLQKKLPKGVPRRDLLVNSFEAYQQTALAMKAYEQGRGERPDATMGAAGVRKGLLIDVLQGSMTPNEQKLYQVWLQGHP